MDRIVPPALRAMAAMLLSAAPVLAQQAPSGQAYAPGKPLGRLPADTGAPAMTASGQAVPGRPTGQLPADTGAPASGQAVPGRPTGQLPTDTGAPRIAPPGTIPPAPSTTTAPGDMGAAAAPAMTPPPATAAAPSAFDAAAGATAAQFSGFGGGLSGSGAGLVEMLGDSPGSNRVMFRQVRPPTPPDVPPPGRPPVPGVPPRGILRSAAIVPSIRSPKLSENQSPQPQDRVYFSFNAYDEVNRTLNRQMGSDLYNLRVYRELIGFEKTFLDGNGSIGMRLPINQLNADSYSRTAGGSSSGIGNLSVILKYAFLWNRDTNNLLSGGLMIDTPTGPSNFAYYPYIVGVNSTSLVPYLGYIYNMGDLYFHGFSSINVPMTQRDVTVIYNDVGLGYWLYRSEIPDRWLTAIVPTFETHVNIPTNHTNYLNFNDPAGTPSVVNLTFGCNFGIGRRGLLSVGYITPMTGPRPFDNEWLAMFNYRF